MTERVDDGPFDLVDHIETGDFGQRCPKGRPYKMRARNTTTYIIRVILLHTERLIKLWTTMDEIVK
jgi:hypothetical protein